MKTRNIIKLLAIFSMLVISSTHAQTIASAALDFDPANIEFKPIANGLAQPLFVTNAEDGSGRLFIIERAGRIRILRNGILLPTPFLDIHSIVNSTVGEQGLLALAFHPNYETNGKFYTVHTNSSGSLVLSMFTRSSTNPDLGNPASRTS